MSSGTRLSIARLVTLTAVAALLAVDLLLGGRHPLATCGLIAWVAALVCGLWLSGGRPVSAAQSLVAGIAGACIAAGLFLTGWHARTAALIPAFVQALLSVLVARTLRRGSVPVIQRIGAALQVDGAPLPSEVARYARHSTWMWSVLFATLAGLNASIVLLNWPTVAPPLPLGIFDAAAAGMLLVLEYFYRRWRYAKHNRHTLVGFLLGLRAINPVQLLLARSR